MILKISTLFRHAAVLLLMAVILPVNTSAQKAFDYNRQPHAPYEFKELNLTISLDSVSGTVSGQAVYNFQPKLHVWDTLVLHAAHMDIKEVSWNESEADYTIQNDSLLISPPEGLIEGNTQKLSIRYSAVPKFGIHKNNRGTVWTSLLPRSHRHWFPVFDHPGNTLITTLRVETNRTNTSIVASGDKLENSNRWIHEEKIPATAIAFAAGNFEQTETMAGIKTISLYNEAGIITDDRKSELLREAHSALTQTQKELGIEYPHQSLNIIVLEDHKWEQKAYGAGIGFIYLNRGNLTEQLRRIIQAQWIGVSMREEQWSEAPPTILLQSWLAEQVFDSVRTGNISQSASMDSAQTVYHNFSKENRDRWQYSLSQWEAEGFRFADAVNTTARNFFDRSREIFNWQSYSDFLYRHTGHLWKQPPELEEPAVPDSIQYNVEYLYDDMSADLKMVFTAIDSVVNTLVTTQVKLKDLQGRTVKEVVFTGSGDTVDVDTEGAIMNAGIVGADTAHIYFNEMKPMSFWLEQLRNAGEAVKRAEATKGLANYADNPDLQLALLDILDREEDPGVIANLLRTLAKITDGATGTEQQFLKQLNHNDKRVRLAALAALRNYPENEQVKRRVQRNIELEGDPDIVRTALTVFSNIADTATIVSELETLTTGDTKGKFVPDILDRYLAIGDTTSAVTTAQLYMDNRYPYSLRREIIEVLLTYHREVEGWQEIMENLLHDTDPRIRYRVVDIATLLKPEVGMDLIEKQIVEEYDARVVTRLKEVKDSLGSSDEEI